MMSRSVFLTILLTLVLSACSGQVISTSTANQPPTTANSTSQDPAPATAGAVPLGVPTLSPTNPPGCTDDATFVEDVTVPDGTNFNPGTVYTKTWRIRNSGTCAWNSDYSIVFASGEKSGAPDSTPLAYTAPDETLDISMELTTPAQKGTATTNFQLRNPAGKLISISGGIYLYVSVYVSPDAAPTASGSAATQPAGTGSAGGACPYTTDPSKAANAISAINSYRAQNGLPALTVNPLLTLAAEKHAADMACNNLFGHTGSNGSSAVSRVAGAGYAASSVAENVYGSYPPLSGQGVVAWWATDQTDLRHNENLISTKYTEVGLAYAFHNNFGYYVVDFAAP